MAYGFTRTLPAFTGTHDLVVLLTTGSFPTLALNGPNEFLNGGGNLRAYTSSAKTTALPVEVVKLVAGVSADALVWVRVPSASTGSTIYIEADDVATSQPAVGDPLGRNETWQDYEYVFHFESSGELIDATGNHAINENGTINQVTGKVGEASDSGGNAANYYNLTAYTGPTGAQARTHTQWIKTASNVTAGLEYGTNNNGERYTVRIDNNTVLGGFRTEVQGSFAVTNNTFDDDVWHLCVSKVDGTSTFPGCYSAVVDGVNQTLTTGSNVTINTVASGNILFKTLLTTNRPAYLYDEQTLRLFHTSDDQDATEYAMQNDPANWGTSSAWEDQGGGGGFQAAWARSINYMIQSSQGAEMKKNTASQSIGVQMVNAADGTAFTGAASVLVTIDNGTQTAGGGTAPAHEGNGYHSYTPTQAETNGDHIAFTFTGTGAIPVTVQVYTSFPQTGDSFTRLGAPAGASVSADIADVPTVSEFNARTLLAADYFDPATDTVANVTTVATCTTNTDMRGTDNALLASSAPTNFIDLAITQITGKVTVGTNDDKTGYSIAGTKTTLDALNDITAASVWAVATRELTSGTNIVLAKGVGVTGFNDIAATDIVTGGAITTSAGVATCDTVKINGTTVLGNGTGANQWRG